MWEQVRSNQKRSTILVITMAIILLLLGYVIGWYFFERGWAGLLIAFSLWVIVSLLAYYQGDSILIAMSGGIKVGKDDFPRLYNIVEEMKIASGLARMPDIYIIYDQALNAFATGTNPDRASIALTSGLIKNLDRDELQGVVGHEIAHMKNRDVLLMSICSVMLGTIVTLSYYARSLFIFGGRQRFRVRPSGIGFPQQLVVMGVSLIIIILAPVVAHLIYYAISRKREYLADASSTLYTRYPEGLASALEKISTPGHFLLSANKVTAPMYIVNPFLNQGRYTADLSSTHPPVSERVRILRSMAGGASYDAYDKAYRRVRHTDTGLLTAGEIFMAGAAAIRDPSPEEKQGETPLRNKIAQTREINDAILRVNKYNFVDCACGARWKVPPDFPDREVLCTRCGQMVKVKN